MCYWILIENGNFIARSTVIPIPDVDLDVTTLKERMEKFTLSIKDVIGNHEKAVVQGETVSDDNIYADALNFDTNDDGITYQWDK